MPTIAESGSAGFDAPAWWAVLAPAKTPADVLQRMNLEINKALRTPEVAGRLAAQGIDLRDSTPASAQLSSKRRWTSGPKVVKDNGIKAE